MIAEFQGPPRGHQNANLFQRAQSVVRLADACRTSLEACDNVDGFDLNSDSGVVLVDKRAGLRLNGRLDLAGLGNAIDLGWIEGKAEPLALQAFIQGTAGETAELSQLETSDRCITQLTVERPVKGGIPESIKVTQDKQTGNLWVEQETQSWAGSARGVLLEEKVFSLKGPEQLADADFYRQGEEIRSGLELQMSSLKTLDNSPDDLNPQEGLVVTAGLTTSVLAFDVASGNPLAFSQRHGEHELCSFKREDDKLVYESLDFQATRVEIKSDGSRRQARFATFQTGEVEHLSQEHLQEPSRLPVFLDSKEAPGLLLESAFIGSVATAALSLLAACSLGPALAGGVAVASTVAFAWSRGLKRPAELGIGVNRFTGGDRDHRLRNATQAFQDYTQTEGASDKPVTRESCAELFRDVALPRLGDRLIILADQYGDSQEPAVLVIPNRLGFPVQMEAQGMVVPGGVELPYSSVKAMCIHEQRRG